MKNNYTDISILLDRSVSMQGMTDETIIGVNKFIDSNKELPGECTVTLVQFADYSQITYSARKIQEVVPLTNESYRADGYSTALVDSMTDLINATGERLSDMPEDQRPDKVIFVTLTDGQENSSSRYTRASLRTKVVHQNKHYNWQFIYLGANQDAIAEAATYGIPAGKALTYAASPSGMLANFKATGNLTRSLRSAVCTSDLDDISYALQDRADNDAEIIKADS